MSFDLKHLPRSFADLVIADPLNAAVIQQYCTQPPSKPLLLAGPPGAGKTETARVIAHSYFANNNVQHMNWEHNGATLGKLYNDVIMSKANYQMFGNPDKALVVINEIVERSYNCYPNWKAILDLIRVRTHNQKMTAAARAIAERKTVGDLS